MLVPSAEPTSAGRRWWVRIRSSCGVSRRRIGAQLTGHDSLQERDVALASAAIHASYVVGNRLRQSVSREWA